MILKHIFLLFLLLAAQGVYAQTVQKPAPSYAELLQKLEQHPALEAVRQQVIEQREASAGAAGLPDPMFMFGLNNYPADGSGGFDRFAMTSKSVGFIQQIPNSGIRAASVEAKRHLAAKAQLAVAFTRQQLQAAWHTALAGKQRVNQQQTLLEQDIRLLQQEAAYWEGRLKAGENVFDARSRVAADLAQAQAKLATLQAEQTQFAAELTRLVGTTEAVHLPELFPLPWLNTAALYPVLMAEKDVLVAQSNVSGADAAFLPNYQLGLTYAQRDNSGNFDGGDFVSAQVGISVPLWASRNQAPKLRSAEAGLYRAHALLADTQTQWQQQMATQQAKIAETIATQKALQQKEKALNSQIESLTAAYARDGRLEQLLAAKRNLLALKAEQAALTARYIQSVSTYNAFFQHFAEPDTAAILPTGERN